MSDTEDSETEASGLAVTRDRRINAGARMSKLLEAEDEDEFYKTTYGGFNEEEDDDDYMSEDSGSDATDSDIDIDEKDEIKSDGEDDAPKRAKRLVTKAYKEPKKASETTQPSKPKPKPPTVRYDKIEIIERGRKALRQSTAEKSRSAVDAAKEREAKAALMKSIADKRKVTSVRRLTQEELLAEAMITEQINLKSLEMYQRLELEKKKSKISRPIHRGPTIRFRSITEKVESDLKSSADSRLTNPLVTEISDGNQPEAEAEKRVEKQARNFVSFSDETVFRQYFPPSFQHARPPVQKSYCIVTGLPARYFDPLTQSPYATVEAFKVLREAYARQQQEDELT